MHTTGLYQHGKSRCTHSPVKPPTCTRIPPIPFPAQPPSSRKRSSDSKEQGWRGWERLERQAEKASTNCISDLITEWTKACSPPRPLRRKTDRVRCYVITDLCPQWSKVSGSWLTLQLQVYACIRMSSRFLRALCGDDSKKQETRAVREKVRGVTTLVA